MAKRNRDYDRDAILTDWKTGEFSERQLALKHKISPATAHNIVKGVGKDLAPLISAQVAIKQELTKFNEQEVSRFEQEVSKKTEHLRFFVTAAIENVEQAMACSCDGQSDFKLRAETILKGKETVLGKEPSAAIQVNTTVNTVDPKKVSDDELLHIATAGR